MYWHGMKAVPSSKVLKKQSQKGFSLIELLVVMGIMATLLVLGASVLGGMGSGESRQGVRSMTTGILTNARNQALTTGEPVAVVMVPYNQGREELFGRGYAVFQVRQDDATGDYSVGKQLHKWVSLPGRFIFSQANTVSAQGQNAFAQAPIVEVPLLDPNGGGQGSFLAPAIIFGGAGNVVWPAGGGELELHFEEGVIRSGRATGLTDANTDWQKREVFVIGRQTGRSRLLRIQ